ncbi:MAG: Rhs element Vgr protein [Symbiobacteriaceae bacterium]|nr:Rhs element Vgr protein [Symbiobacteriaceae bacterium]
MSDLVAMIRQIVQHELAQAPAAQIGVVDAIRSHAEGDTENYACDVRLRGRDLVLTGVPLATPHLGTAAPPAAGDVVLLIYADGRPVIAGRLYSDHLPAPPYAAGEMVTILPPDASPQNRIEIKAKTEGGRSWAVTMPDQTSLTVADKSIAAEVGGLKLQIDGDGKQIAIETGGAKIIIKDGGDVEVQANGNLKLSANANIELNAGGNLTLKANGVAELKGSVVNIN